MKSKLLLIAILAVLGSCKKSTSTETAEVNSLLESTDENGASEESLEKGSQLQLSIDSEEVPISASPSEYDGFQIIGNQRFDFNIDIPSSWSAIAISDDGDGFLLKVPNFPMVEIRVFGEVYDANVIEFYEGSCVELTDFEFRSGLNGKRCVGKEDMTYWLKIEETILQVYIKNWDNLDIAQKTNFTTVAKSLRSSNELPNS